VSREMRLYLDDIVACCDKIGRYTLGHTFERFRDSELVVDAVTRNLELIGEASKAVPDDIRSRYQDVPWRKMAGLRDVVVHGYFRVDVQLLWDIVQKDVPTVRQKIAAIIAVAYGGK
jgi:uncharacterized protein with HEPN domain